MTRRFHGVRGSASSLRGCAPQLPAIPADLWPPALGAQDFKYIRKASHYLAFLAWGLCLISLGGQPPSALSGLPAWIPGGLLVPSPAAIDGKPSTSPNLHFYQLC